MKAGGIIDKDPWLAPYRAVIERRAFQSLEREAVLTGGSSLSSFANGHLWYGLHPCEKGLVLREWAPHAREIFLLAECSDWKPDPAFSFRQMKHGNWELVLEANTLRHQDHYKLLVRWEGGEGERIPAWTRRVVQDPVSRVFDAQAWLPGTPFQWKHQAPDLTDCQPLVYEAHVGMATEEHKVGTYAEFKEKVLPHVCESGYNTLQLMAVQEHPYYGSFGYHVSSFFAPSSRFGSPEDLKALIDEAHGMGLAVIMDLVHSHAVKNVNEGLGLLDGDPAQFFHGNHRREHVAWDSLCFDYGKNEVSHFLLSNIKYWLTEFRFDGFRFDGVTSMLYYDHGLERDFSSYELYFDGGQDEDALTYLTLANKLIREVRPGAISIAEDMSAYPGLASPVEEGGVGFTHRLSMGTPDLWIKMIKEKSDETWNMDELFHELTSKRAEEQTIGYSESHDQALVGDKTIIFRLMDKDMYWHMDKESRNMIVDRGMALHKMIRLLTASTAGNGYLNFMGNEFGHPEWIDFPREGNQWSYQYARRQWSLLENKALRYHELADFDQAMLDLLSRYGIYSDYCHKVKSANDDLVLAFTRKDLLFAFNFHPTNSYTDYGLAVDAGKYIPVLCTDMTEYGGFGRIDTGMTYRSQVERSFGLKHKLNLYLPARTALVLKKEQILKISSQFSVLS